VPIAASVDAAERKLAFGAKESSISPSWVATAVASGTTRTVADPSSTTEPIRTLREALGCAPPGRLTMRLAPAFSSARCS
jgi:hypothetical protein